MLHSRLSGPLREQDHFEKGATMNHVVKITAKEIGNDQVMVKVNKWKQPAKKVDTVQFESLSSSNLDVTLKFPSKRDSPFTNTTIKVPQGETTQKYDVNDNAKGTYKYTVEARLASNDKFLVDPRFIIS